MCIDSDPNAIAVAQALHPEVHIMRDVHDVTQQHNTCYMYTDIFLSHIIMLIWILKVAGALTHDCSWSSIFLQGKVLTYSCQLPY